MDKKEKVAVNEDELLEANEAENAELRAAKQADMLVE